MITASISLKDVDGQTIRKAISPELNIQFSRANVKINKHKNGIALEFKADDVTALRATMNSYLRWLKVITEINEELRDTKTS